MQPTKIALDPCFQHDYPEADLMNELKKSSTILLTSELRAADLVRTFQLIKSNDLAIKAAGGNEIKARFYVQLINRFEELIHAGWGFSAALYQMLAEKWLINLSNFDSLD